MSKKKRRSPAWFKLVVDGREMCVFSRSRPPVIVGRLRKLRGVEVVSATFEERKTFLAKEQEMRRKVGHEKRRTEEAC